MLAAYFRIYLSCNGIMAILYSRKYRHVVFTIIIATSRLILKRHTIIEILTGAATGFIAGIANNYFQK